MNKCSLVVSVDCELEHSDCKNQGRCQGHVKPVCDHPARYRLSGSDLNQYACFGHIDIMLRIFPRAKVTSLTMGARA